VVDDRRRVVGPDRALAERGVEVGQRLEHEARARARRVAAEQEPVVEAEDGKHALVLSQRAAQGGVVADAEVAAEPDDRGHVLATGRRPV
jgi:hypothetical protein